MQRSTEAHWLPRGHFGLAFPRPGATAPSLPSPTAGTVSTAPSDFTSSTENNFRNPPTEPDPPEGETDATGASLGVAWPSSRQTVVVHTVHRIPLPCLVPSSAFLPPSTVFSHLGLAGLFHPTATYRVRPSGGFPLRRAVPGFPSHYPHAVTAARPPVHTSAIRLDPTTPRPQGVAPHEESGDFRQP